MAAVMTSKKREISLTGIVEIMPLLVHTMHSDDSLPDLAELDSC